MREAVARAARRAGRDPDSVRLVAVTKGVALDRIREAMACGLRDFGENRVQEAREKWRALGPGAGCRWHFVGHLQTNKVRHLLEFGPLIHSLDRWDLAVALDRRAARLGRPVDALVQVNVAGEATKFGLAPGDTPAFIERCAALPHLRLVGLMTIAPPATAPETVRPVFRRLRELGEAVRARGFSHAPMTELSMGMSGDFPVAVEEGATLIRVGTALFGPRDG